MRKNGCIKSRKVATDDTIENLQNGAKKFHYQHNYVILVNCIEDMVRRKEQSFENRGTRSGSTEHMN